MKRYPTVLTIAGSDSGGGAGIQADIKAISATGSYAASAITAVTVQNTMGVRAVHDIPVDVIRGQIEAVLEDIGASAVKIGMLSSSEIILAVRDALVGFSPANIVLDPVMVATSGDRLLNLEAVQVLLTELAPLARIVTPNIPEAEILTGLKIRKAQALPEAAVQLSASLSSASDHKVSVLMKAGHLEDEEVTDYLYDAEEDRMTELRSPRIHSVNTHGTGCTLSSAIASYLAQGYGLEQACVKAKAYLSEALSSGAEYEIGHGHGPVDHFFMLNGTE